MTIRRLGLGRLAGRVWLFDALVASALVFTLHGRSLISSLSYDDPIILSHAIRFSPFKYLFDPVAWQSFNWRGFYPFYLISFDVGYRIAGLSPVSFRIYQLFLVAAVGVLFACLLRLWGVRPGSARAASAILLLGPVFGTVAWQLMTRCFLEGAVLLLAASCVVTKGLWRRSFAMVATGSALWLAASLEKEVFVPFLLPIVIAAALVSVRFLVPPATCAGVYLAYRSWMAPYGVRVYDVDALGFRPFVSHVADFIRGLPQALFPGSGAAGTAILAAIVIVAAVLGPRNWRRILLVGATAGAAVGPVLLVSEVLSERHVVHIWIVLALWLTLGLEEASARRDRWRAVLSLATTAGLAAFLVSWSQAHEDRLRVDAAWTDDLYRLFFSVASPNDTVVGDTLSVHPPFAAGLNILRKRDGDGLEVPFLVTDAAALCRHPFPTRARLWDVRGREIRSSLRLPEELSQKVCSLIRRSGPLQVQLRKRGSLLEWELGPSTAGVWSLVFLTTDKDVGGPGIRYDVPRKGGVWVPSLDRPAELYVQHIGDDGGIEQSPDFSFRLDRDAEIHWRR